MSTELLLEALRSRGALSQYLNGKLPVISDIERHIYVGVRGRNHARPDHQVKNYLRLTYGSISSVKDLLIKTYEQLSKVFLTQGPAPCWVNGDKFAEWQNIITEISPLSIVTWNLLSSCDELPQLTKELVKFVRDKLEPQMKYSALPTLSDDRLNKLIQEQGLDDLHVHLNGCTEAELVWRDALSRPLEFAHQLKRGKHKQNVNELFEQEDPSLTHEALLSRLSIAQNLRFFLFKSATGSQTLPDLQRILTTERLPEANSWNIEEEFHSFPEITPLLKEALFLLYIFKHLKGNATTSFSHGLYAYLLIQAQIFRLLVQQTDQIGFDQFQKITENEIRELTEKEYKHRYHQLDYSLTGDIAVLEGRFAPSTDNNKNESRIQAILDGYARYHEEKEFQTNSPIKANSKTPSKREATFIKLQELLEFEEKKSVKMRLSLVAHFIKKPDRRLLKLISTSSKENIWLCRHFELREELEETHRRLRGLQDKFLNLKKYLNGFDAAANELHANPEVFAPLFRRLRNDGHNNFTFHAGEEFVHLISGIRYVYEAITYLDMRKGNRIGHGTAVGIDPDLWRKKIGNTIVMNQGARLDDLVFARELLLEEELLCDPLKVGIESEIARLSQNIYGVAYSSINLFEAWKMRGLDPIIAFELKYPRNAYLCKESELELGDIRKAETKAEAYEIFKRYHEADVVTNSEKLIEINIADLVEKYFTKSEIRLLQKCVLKEINKREMAIEVLPTSNMRISFYDTIAEHHIYSWLGIEKEEGMSVPVCLGSDDPGIFSTNLRNEYAHILNELERKCNDKMEAINQLTQLVINGKKWRFRDPRN